MMLAPNFISTGHPSQHRLIADKATLERFANTVSCVMGCPSGGFAQLINVSADGDGELWTIKFWLQPMDEVKPGPGLRIIFQWKTTEWLREISNAAHLCPRCSGSDGSRCQCENDE
jgi:hypothetical protein